ncbi:cytochrome P450 [Halobacillus litoralis]|uniref:Cytochrome P450 n=1 Tax=Halobacillus litoralis TaxID=45668 RepID=A0A845DYF2_9BACI|nr:cytochrome P450 [Halobacillus litoralis]MYL48375.1 cytochrome P450 [Halobacillus litoralis]
MHKWKSRSPLGQLPAFKKDPLAFLMEMEETQKPVTRFRFAHRPMFMLMHPALIQEVLVRKADSFYKSKPFQELEPLLGKGLLLSEGQLHKQQRRKIQPFFTPKHIQRYCETMGRVVTDHTSLWKDGERLISEDIRSITLKIITETMFGTEVRADHDKVGQQLDTAMEIATERIRSVFKSPRSWKTVRNKLFDDAVDKLDEVVYSIIHQPHASGEHLLSVMKEAEDAEGNKMDARQLRDEVMTVFLAGHETTASALIWTLQLLMKHPDCYQKVESEIEQTLSSDTPSVEETGNLLYTKKVILESMRLYPPAWMFGRRAKEDVNIGSTFIKKGATVMVSPYLMHRHRRYIDYPDEFLPERFEDGRLLGGPDYLYLPFGGGPRVCIGQHFAMLEMLVILSSLIKSYTFAPSSDAFPVKAEPLVTLRMKHGLKVQLSKKGAGNS